MNAHATGVEVALWPTSRERVVKLLGRYPQVSKNENWEILEFMKNGRHLDIGLLTSDQSLKANLDVFMEDHQKRFRASFGEATAVVGMIAAILLSAWLFWELIGPSPS